jgi:imidazole glycerol-phosphate synthase subunit HisH
MHVLIIDYGMGNLGSVRRAFEECGANVRISADPADAADADRIVLPGVGAFAAGMANLHSAGWPKALAQARGNPRVGILGICLGMQLLADRGYENGDTPGLALIPGEVVRLVPTLAAERIPHVGWNEITPAASSPLLDGIAAGTDFYFVHSYHFVPKNPGHVLARTPYCGSVVAATFSANVFGTQFHPEKSSRPGFRLLRNFLSQALLDA